MTNHKHMTAGEKAGRGDILLPSIDDLNPEDKAEVRRRNLELESLEGNGMRRFGLLPFPDVAASIQELSFILDTAKMDGVCIIPFASGRCLDEREFAPLLAEIDRRGATLLIHPVSHSDRPLIDMRALDSLLAFSRLLYYGAINSMENTSFILAHTEGIEYFLAENTGILYYLQASRWRMGRFMADYVIRKRLRGVEMVRNVETTE